VANFVDVATKNNCRVTHAEVFVFWWKKWPQVAIFQGIFFEFALFRLKVLTGCQTKAGILNFCSTPLFDM
jgi:hypothetical protein